MILSFLITFILGFLTSSLLFKNLKNIFLKIAVSFGLGFILEAFLLFLILISNIKSNWNIIFLSIILLYIAISCFIIKKKNLSIFNHENNKENKPLFILFISTLFFSFYEIILHFIKEPSGSWDGHFIWNFHTRFFYSLYSNEMNYTHFFNNTIKWTHLDYPLLLPMYNLKTFILTNTNSYSFGAITSVLFFIMITFLLIGTIEEISDRKNALIAGLILISTKSFLWESGTQCADIPLSFLFLAPFCFLLLYNKYGEKNFLITAFFFASASAFCKNEGILFFFIFTIFYLFLNKFSNLKNILYGIIIPLFFVLYFKLFIYSQSDLFTQKNMMISIGKLKYILEYLFWNLSNFINLIIIGIFSFFTGKRNNEIYNNTKKLMILTLIFLTIGYISIYLISPHDITWHLSTSSIRLMTQGVPLFILLIFLSFNCCSEKFISKTKDDCLKKVNEIEHQ